jgi:hypothetical protein
MNFPEELLSDKYKIITLCGSTKFKDIFYIVNRELTLNNKIILMPGCYAHADNITITDEQKINLDKLHKEKIDISDCIYVINDTYGDVANYIGESTITEIDYALANNKPVFYMHN